MEIKKSKKASLQDMRGINFLLGLIVALAAIFFFFESLLSLKYFLHSYYNYSVGESKSRRAFFYFKCFRGTF